MKTKKSKRKLLVQTAIIVFVLFAAAIMINTYNIYNGVVDVFLSAKNDMLTEELNRAKQTMAPHENYEWFFDYWEEHYNEIASYNNDAPDKELIMNFLNNPDMSSKELNALSEKDQLDIAYNMYSMVNLTGSVEKQKNDYNRLFCIDVSDENAGFVFFDYPVNNDNDKKNTITGKKLGEKIDFKLNEHPEVQKAIESSSKDIVFARPSGNFENQYFGILPLMSDGKVKYAIGITYDWSKFNKGLQSKLSLMVALEIGGLLLISAVLLLFLYRSAIRPLTMVNDGVKEYMRDKDSEKVSEQMARVKSKNEVGALAEDFSALALEIDRYTEENLKLTGEQERMTAELDMAKNIQASQLPNTFPAFPDRDEFDIYASMTPAKEVGGDFYDFFLIDDDHLAMVIADVTGKGVPAALFMMMSKIIISNYAMMGISPHDVLERANETIFRNNKQKMFVTVWLGILEISSGKITAANAGHEYPIIKQPNGEFELFKEKHGLMVGIIKNAKYKDYEFTLKKGGTLMVYTDGVVEAMNSDREMFRKERLLEALNSRKDSSPKELLESVHKSVNEFVGNAPQFDDLTMLAIKT